MPEQTHQSFHEACRESVQRLRMALLEVYRSVGADPTKPQDVSRRFGVNRNLAWKVARILREESALDAVPLIPRAGSLDILLEAMASTGAPAERVATARSACEEFDAMVELHVGDRAALELLLDSMGKGSQKPLEMSRKLTFRGNSGLWGMKVATRVTAQFIAPSSDDPTMLDTAQVAGLSRAYRFRSVPRWPVFRIGRYSANQSLAPFEGRRPIDPDCDTHPGLIAPFCEGVMPELFSSQRGDGLYYEIGDGPIGKQGEFTCYFGFLNRKFVTRYSQSDNPQATLAATVTMPAESLLFDLFVHEDLMEGINPRAEVYGKLWDEAGIFESTAMLPITEDVIDLGKGVHVGTPLVDRYDELIDMTFQQSGWDSKRFHCLRLVMDYPPMSSTVAVQINLPRADAQQGPRPTIDT